MPSHLKPDWDRFPLSEGVWASRAPSGRWLVLYEPGTDKVLVVLRRSEVNKLLEHLESR